MKISYNWLNDYFAKKLPPALTVAEALTMNALEVESIEEGETDQVLDVKTTPNMAHHCLSHRGVAEEMSAVLNLPKTNLSRQFGEYAVSPTQKNVTVSVADATACPRYLSRVIEGVKVGPSPKWLVDRLEALGQRSINNLVDATNFIMLEIGQPLHVFDAYKLEEVGQTIPIEVSFAEVGMEITTLDQKEMVLDEHVLMISNNKQPLAIAGVKGGDVAEVDNTTKNVVLEAANFNAPLIRRTSQKLKLQTDASKRYENEITPELAGEGMELLTRLIVELAGTPDLKIGTVVDIYPQPVETVVVPVTSTELTEITGLSLTPEVVMNIFKRLAFPVTMSGETFQVTIPSHRLDIRLKEDLAEEVGRIYGYSNIPDVDLPQATTAPVLNKKFYYTNEIRSFLLSQGFSEVMTYTFVEAGEISLANPLVSDRPYLRTSIGPSLARSLETNARYADLIDMAQVKIFEISNVFLGKGEETHLAVGVMNASGDKKLPKDSVVLTETMSSLAKVLGVELQIGGVTNVAELNLDELLTVLPPPTQYNFNIPLMDSNFRFKKISNYPYITRDVAVFVPEGTLVSEIEKIFTIEGGENLVSYRQFDLFTKTLPDGTKKTSYAYRLVFQSYTETLTTAAIDVVMAKITGVMNSLTGWQVR